MLFGYGIRSVRDSLRWGEQGPISFINLWKRHRTWLRTSIDVRSSPFAAAVLPHTS
jgi:hypothetical protein